MLNHVEYLVQGERFLVQFLARAVRGNGNAGARIAYVWQRTWLKIAGTCGLLGAAITFHAIYNLLIAYGGAAQYIAYLLPVLIPETYRTLCGQRFRREA